MIDSSTTRNTGRQKNSAVCLKGKHILGTFYSSFVCTSCIYFSLRNDYTINASDGSDNGRKMKATYFQYFLLVLFLFFRFALLQYFTFGSSNMI